MARNEKRHSDLYFLRNWLFSVDRDEEYTLGEVGEVPAGYDFVKEIHIKEEDIGMTRVDCSLCHYTLSARNGAAPLFCPCCNNLLLFVDVTEDFFEDD